MALNQYFDSHITLKLVCHRIRSVRIQIEKWFVNFEGADWSLIKPHWADFIFLFWCWKHIFGSKIFGLTPSHSAKKKTGFLIVNFYDLDGRLLLISFYEIQLSELVYFSPQSVRPQTNPAACHANILRPGQLLLFDILTDLVSSAEPSSELCGVHQTFTTLFFSFQSSQSTQRTRKVMTAGFFLLRVNGWVRVLWLCNNSNKKYHSWGWDGFC